METSSARSGNGVGALLGAYVFWGLTPIYWKQFEGVDAFELMAHRVVWCSLFIMSLYALRGRIYELRALWNRQQLPLFAFASLLLCANGLAFVWAIEQNRISATSLGYFLAPLAVVALARFAEKERLRPLQQWAVAAAVLGVAYETLALGELPWEALVIAGTWSCYGLIKKRTRVDALPALWAEVTVAVPVAVAFLLYREWGQRPPGLVSGWEDQAVLLLLTGPVTALPLGLFAWGARRTPLNTVGLLQYAVPTVSLLVAVLLYGEPFRQTEAISFGCIWLGLVLYTLDRFRRPQSKGAGA